MNCDIIITIVDGKAKQMTFSDESGNDVEVIMINEDALHFLSRMFTTQFVSEQIVKKLAPPKGAPQIGAVPAPKKIEKITEDYDEEKDTKEIKVKKVTNTVQLGQATAKPKVVTRPCKMKIRQGKRKGITCGKQVFKYGKCPYHWGKWRKANPFMRTPKSY